jgi:hypothetical protein
LLINKKIKIKNKNKIIIVDGIGVVILILDKVREFHLLKVEKYHCKMLSR